MYSLEHVTEEEYNVFLPEGESLIVTVSNGTLDEEMTRISEHTTEEVTPSSLPSDLKGFIRARTGLDWEN